MAATRFLWRLRRLRGTADALGRGFAVGAFVAFTPTVGLQMVAAALLATLVKGSRPAAILPVWISNPLTFPVVYGTTYRVGRQLWPRDSSDSLTSALGTFIAPLQTSDPWELWTRVRLGLTLGQDVAIPLWLGGILVGLVAAATVYGTTIAAVWAARHTLRRHQSKRARARPGDTPGETGGSYQKNESAEQPS